MKPLTHPLMIVSQKDYKRFVSEIKQLLENARRRAAKSVNTILTVTYWEIGRRIVQFEQKGKGRASYGDELLIRLSRDLINRFGRGFGLSHVKIMRQFYLTYPDPKKRQSLIGQLVLTQKSQSMIDPLPGRLASDGGGSLSLLEQFFPLSWTHYTRLLRVKNEWARRFYEAEAVRGSWSVRQLDRQIESQFYERTVLSRNKAAMLTKDIRAKPGDVLTADEEIKDPYVLEFLGLKDEYSETELEEALIHHLEAFLLELGGDFTFVARQKRLRVGNQWYRVDLVFYHRQLRCLVLIDLKIGSFSHADAGQMHLYLNYARENWTLADENPPVGLILCAEKDAAVAHYALEGLPNKVLASEYKTKLPTEREIAKELRRTKLQLDAKLAFSGIGKKK